MKPHKITFANCMLDVGGRKLFIDGRPRILQPLVFDLLLYMLTSNGRIVSKRELVEAVWLGRDPTSAVVSRAIMKVRRLVCVHAPNGLIWTIHGNGYRLASDVEVSIHHFESDVREVRGSALAQLNGTA
jgi:DNA-binding winged helix-turn-helix (wHTH) protein